MTRPVEGWAMTGRPLADVRAWLDNTDIPPKPRAVFEAEYETVTGQIAARVMEQNARDAERWVETFDGFTADLDAVVDAYENLRARALDGRVTADQMDEELVRLDARRRTLEARATQPERDAERIAQVAADPLASYDALLTKFASLPRPQFSFVPVRPL